jgi:DnaJ-class molecular chaperone
MYVERYCFAVNTSDLRDDEYHRATEALVAAAMADMTGSGAVLGSLLCRVKFTDGTIHKLFESGTANLASLLRIWTAVVTEKGRSRGWVKANTEWDMRAAIGLYQRVAAQSLAFWLDGRCEVCEGAKVNQHRRNCECCAGSGQAKIEGLRYEVELVKDMVSELEGLFISHSSRAGSLLRRAA